MGVTKIEQVQAKGDWGGMSKLKLFYDNLITECPSQKVLAVFQRKNFAIIFSFSNHFLIILKNMSLNNFYK